MRGEEGEVGRGEELVEGGWGGEGGADGSRGLGCHCLISKAPLNDGYWLVSHVI